MGLGFGIQDFKFHKEIRVTYTRLQISQRNVGLGLGLELGIQDFKCYKKIRVSITVTVRVKNTRFQISQRNGVRARCTRFQTSQKKLRFRLPLRIQDFKFHEEV